MNKRIFITNGMACSGKDTFANMLNDIVPTMKISSIDYIKQVARHCGWDGEKDEKSRKFLCDLKNLTTEYNDLAFRIITSRVLHFYEVDPRNEVLLIDIREPDEIRKFCKEFPETKTILITRKSVKNITSNVADDSASSEQLQPDS